MIYLKLYRDKLVRYHCGNGTLLHGKKSLQQNIRKKFSGPAKKTLQTPSNNHGLATKPFDNIQLTSSPISVTRMWKPCLFAIAFSGGSLLGSSIWEYENIRATKAKGSATFTWFKNKLQQSKPKEWRKDVETWFKLLTPGERVFVPICLLNILVFTLWRIPRLQSTMLKYFCSNPAARVVCWPMVLSTFSHYSILHIMANMYVLHSFSIAAVNCLGKEQFVGMYLSAGVFSTLISYIYKVSIRSCGPSLGASGAIMAVLAFVCAEYPETQLTILFLPNITFSAGTAIKFIIGADFAGCLLRWKFFDHAAHFGGALFGLFWFYFGSQSLWPKRECLVKHWHNLRSSKSNK